MDWNFRAASGLPKEAYRLDSHCEVHAEIIPRSGVKAKSISAGPNLIANTKLHTKKKKITSRDGFINKPSQISCVALGR
jgi:hypothetical protein